MSWLSNQQISDFHSTYITLSLCVLVLKTKQQVLVEKQLKHSQFMSWFSNHKIFGFRVTEKKTTVILCPGLRNKNPSTGRKANETLSIYVLDLKPADFRLSLNRKNTVILCPSLKNKTASTGQNATETLSIYVLVLKSPDFWLLQLTNNTLHFLLWS